MAARFNLSKFSRDSCGNVALAFGLALIPMVGAAGMALDLQSAANSRNVLQNETDAAALEVMKIAVEVQTNAANANKSQTERNAMIEARAAQVLSTRQAIAESRLSGGRISNLTFSGVWADGLKTEYRFTAGANVKRYIRLAGFGSSAADVPILTAATAKMDVKTSSTTSVPKLANPGYEAGDYNRIYAYCYDDSKKGNAAKGRSQMTPVSSNGTDNGTPELQTNAVFSAVKMPVCGSSEILSWRLYNVRGERTNKSKWPKDTWNNTTKLWEQTDKSGTQIYNHYSDTKIDPITGLEEYAFRGDAFGQPRAIKMMETVVCDTMDKCTPGKPGAITPSGKNRNPVSQNLACSPGKFMYLGWEDRPFLVKNPNLNDYSTNNSFEWTDSDYDDITLVISCPEKTITEYKTKIWLIK